MQGWRSVFSHKVIVVLASLWLTACAMPPKTLSDASQYRRVGVLPAYEPQIAKWTPPNWSASAKNERFDVDLGVNGLVMERVTKAMSQSREIVDLKSFTPAYVRIPKVRSSGERKVIGDSRPMMTEVVRSLVGTQGLDAYVVIDGGAARIYEPGRTPAEALIKAASPPNVSVQISIYVIDGRTFEVAAAAHTTAVEKGVPLAWFQAPEQNADAIKSIVVKLLDQDVERMLRQVGLL